MLLTKHQTPNGARWAIDHYCLPPSFNLSMLLELPCETMFQLLRNISKTESAIGEVEAPIDPYHEVWAAGVTYLRSRDARHIESTVADMYDRVYEADRPELFFKSIGWRMIGNRKPICIRADSQWNVPEPELVLVVNRHREIVGYCAGNDVSSRDIEGENPLYLPQAKMYNGSCALGHGIFLCDPDEIKDISIRLSIKRAEQVMFSGEASTILMKRSFTELVEYLTRQLEFPHGVFLMTGTCLIPDDNFTLEPDDVVWIQVGELSIENRVRRGSSNDR
jgi:2-dehydro-3-deoxy-D-arabinonate dehydratase